MNLVQLPELTGVAEKRPSKFILHCHGIEDAPAAEQQHHLDSVQLAATPHRLLIRGWSFVLPMRSESHKQIVLRFNHEGLVLHRKEYLQGFEVELAAMELKGLGFKVERIEHDTSRFHVSCLPGCDVQKATARLTYFDWSMNECFLPTLQAIREGADSSASPGSASLPRRRILRFGPHDFHEYRGKFFPQLVRSLCNVHALTEGSVVLDPMCGSGTTLAEGRALDLDLQSEGLVHVLGPQSSSPIEENLPVDVSVLGSARVE